MIGVVNRKLPSITFYYEALTGCRLRLKAVDAAASIDAPHWRTPPVASVASAAVPPVPPAAVGCWRAAAGGRGKKAVRAGRGAAQARGQKSGAHEREGFSWDQVKLS